jgi:hypothetical protein
VAGVEILPGHSGRGSARAYPSGIEGQFGSRPTVAPTLNRAIATKLARAHHRQPWSAAVRLASTRACGWKHVASDYEALTGST